MEIRTHYVCLNQWYTLLGYTGILSFNIYNLQKKLHHGCYKKILLIIKNVDAFVTGFLPVHFSLVSGYQSLIIALPYRLIHAS